MRAFLLALLLIGIFAIAYVDHQQHATHPPGVLIASAPSQYGVTDSSEWTVGKYRAKPLAEFRARARVLRTERYWFDRGASVSPVDLVLGWGPMSDQSVLDQLSISQGGRFYSWRPNTRTLRITPKEIGEHSANVHMVPATKSVNQVLLSTRAGDIIALRGKLVELIGDDGGRWRSSLTRTDTGSGSCELIWAEELKVER